jgi:hypothetical protein
MSMAKYNINALPFSGFDIEFDTSHRNLRPVPVRRMTVSGRFENNFTGVFVGSSGSASDTRGTGRKCDFKTDFLQNRLFGIMMAPFRLWDWQYCLCGQAP